MYFSVKGVLRVYGGPFLANTAAPMGAPQPKDVEAGKFSLARALRFSARGLVGVSSAPLKVLQEMIYMSADGRAFQASECVFDWTAAYGQDWTHIRIGVNLKPQNGVTQATLDNLKATWKPTTESTWSNQFGCSRAGELMCPITLTLTWGVGHDVDVMSGNGPTDMGTWYAGNTGGLAAAHECGHMLGLYDEYEDEEKCPDRSPIDLPGLMGDGSIVRSRYLKRVGALIHSELVSL
jgi:hypothetical protein